MGGEKIAPGYMLFMVLFLAHPNKLRVLSPPSPLGMFLSSRTCHLNYSRRRHAKVPKQFFRFTTSSCFYADGTRAPIAISRPAYSRLSPQTSTGIIYLLVLSLHRTSLRELLGSSPPGVLGENCFHINPVFLRLLGCMWPCFPSVPFVTMMTIFLKSIFDFLIGVGE